MQIVETNGVTLHCRFEAGSGRALVFVNSLGTDFQIWDAVVEALSAGHAILRYDKRGHGLSDIGTGPGTIETHVRDLAGLMDHHGLTDAVIVGLSVGGLIAQGLALARPDLVGALVLSNTAHRIGTREMWAERIDIVRSRGLGAIADGVMEKWFTAAFRRDDNPLYQVHRTMFERSSVEGYIATCEAIARADFTDECARIAVPTLCVAGSHDGSTPPALVRELASLIPGARYELVEEAGHIPNVERADVYAAILQEFLGSLRGGEQPRSGDRYQDGMAVRRRVLGAAHVERAGAAITDFDRPFQRFITEGAWGSVWSGRQLTLRERSIVTIALLAALGQDDEIAMHVRATANTGASQEDISEALMHVAVYAGVPAANHAIKIAKATFAQMKGEGAQ